MIDRRTTVPDFNAQLEASQVELAALRQKILEAEILQAANLALTQSDLDSLIGTTRESVNKAMSTFRREGLILVRQNHLIIADLDALREYTS